MDIATLPRADGAGYDYAVEGGSLAIDTGLQTAITLSLLTDRRVDDNEAEAQGGNASRRGWWGDALNPRPIGSRLWLLDRSKLTTSVLATAVEYAREALNWLVEDSLVKSLEVTAEAFQPAGAGNKEILALSVHVVRDDRAQTYNVNLPRT